jgi:uncharacterized damage-inducible protein DinB
VRVQEKIIEATCAAAREAFAYAKAVPADKLEWQPLDNGRSVLDICQELALCPTWCYEIVRERDEPMPEWSEETAEGYRREQQQWKTAEACEAECNRRLEQLFEVFRSMPDSRLEEKKWLPYDGGRDFTMEEMMDYPRWNFTYHLGQIAYIQTLYGDKEMYSSTKQETAGAS